MNPAMTFQRFSLVSSICIRTSRPARSSSRCWRSTFRRAPIATWDRPGMELWRILVMGVLKQGLGCDFDRLHELVNQHRTVREFLGHGAFSQDDTYELQTIIDNVYLLTPELLSEIGQLVVESGHAVARKMPGEALRGRCDSFVVETDVHYPTDVNLLWDAMRCLLGELGRAARKHHLGGWRQWRHLTREVKKCFNKVRSTRRAKSQPDRVEAYLERCWHLVGRAEESCKGPRCICRRIRPTSSIRSTSGALPASGKARSRVCRTSCSRCSQAPEPANFMGT